MSERALSELVTHLNSLPRGPVEDTLRVTRLLSNCWNELAGSEGGMTSHKIHRIEKVQWNPPLLEFEIERHGGTVHGSTRAEIQEWIVSVETRRATLERGSRYRQLEPQDARLNVKPIAEGVATLIVNFQDDQALKWSGDRKTVTIQIGKLIPENIQQTTTDRRKRFRAALEPLLLRKGWSVVPRKPNSYAAPVDMSPRNATD